MWDCGWPAPAKINLFLHVTGRRADGYHELQTLFQFLHWGDALHFRVRRDGVIRRTVALPDVAAGDDLCLRAARELQACARTPLGVDLCVHKHIPPGGGLGGGSSNAATALVALNRLWGTGLAVDDLAALALGLGADVPVFVHGQAAWAEGVGERLAPADPPTPWYVLVLPRVSVPTRAVFGAAELTRDTPPITIRDFLSGAVGNDCEPVVRQRFPVVDEAFRVLAAQGLSPRMSGTGASVFAPCASESAARQARAALPAGWRAVVARGLNRSPLLAHLEARAEAQGGVT